ncbi:MAG: hypothetical protein ACI8SE_000186 [Bacteroidia bacterium]|jgi:hypothetical protein
MYIGEYKVLDVEYDELMGLASHYKKAYATNAPFPNIYFDDFFNDAFLSEVLSEFPEMGDKGDIQYKTPNEIKLASRGETRFGKATKVFMHFLNSEPFLNFLTELTGIENLMGDPYYEGGGCHQIKRGGFLKVHADFNKHKRTDLDRRLNVLIYLNKDWKEKYGGHFELWNDDMTKGEKKILPLFNRMAMFSTTDFSYHGHPDKLNCPEDRSRRSLALYYYTNGRPSHEVNEGLEDHTTLFVERKGVESEKSMRTYNTVVNLANNWMPPVIWKAIKRMRDK